MGSAGTDHFSDYPRQKPIDPKVKNGGASGNDDCDWAFDTKLEEVSRCQYYVKYKDVPAVDTSVTVVFNGSRLAAVNKAKEEIGYLPTKFNKLKACIDNGFRYGGTVTSSSKIPTPSVTVDITPL